MSDITFKDILQLKIPAILSLAVSTTLVLIFYLFFADNDSLYIILSGMLMSFFGFLAFFYCLCFLLRYYKIYREDKRKIKISAYFKLPIFVAICVIAAGAIPLHEVFFRPRIERNPSEHFTDIGHLKFNDVVYENGTFSVVTNFSLNSSWENPLDLFRMAISINKGVDYEILDYNPKKHFIQKEICTNEIYFKWKNLPANSNGYIKLELNWNDTVGDKYFEPINLDSDRTYIKIETDYPIKWVKKP